METAVQIEDMTDHECEVELNKIDLLFDNKADIFLLPAARKLERLLFLHGKEIQALCTKNPSYKRRMTQLRDRLDNVLLSDHPVENLQ